MCAGAGSEIVFPIWTMVKGDSTLGKISRVLLMPMLKCGERKEEKVGIGEMLSSCSLGCECSSSKCLYKPSDVLQYLQHLLQVDSSKKPSQEKVSLM